jgi:hypothetical protein
MRDIGIQIAQSLFRAMAGFPLAAVVAIPLGVPISVSPLLNAEPNLFMLTLPLARAQGAHVTVTAIEVDGGAFVRRLR